MTPRAASLLGLLLLVGGSASARDFVSSERGTGQGPLEIRADTLSATEGGDRITAEGSVVLTWGPYRLVALHAAYSPKTGLAHAEGDVTLEDKSGNVLRCRRLEVDVNTQKGEIEDGRLWIPREGYRVWGRRFRKTGPVSYEVEDGGFTSCDGTWPSWQVEADRIEVELEGYLKGRGAVFSVESVPVLYTPYIVFPVKRERQSGFLVPKFGYSDRSGAQWTARYFWVLGDSADLTGELNYGSRRGWTEKGELRYVLAEGHGGFAGVSHLYDRQEQTTRYTVDTDHKSRFSDGSRLRVKGNYVGDRNYLKDTGDTLDQRGVQTLESFLLGTRDIDQGTPFVLADYYEALDTSQAETLQTLPSAGFFSRETPVVGPLLWDPWVRGTNFWRAEGVKGQRIELYPAVAVDSAVGGVGIAGRVGYRENLYRVEEENVSRGAATAEIDTGVTLFRGYGSFLHTLDPSVRLFWQESGRGGDPPQFDVSDRFERAVGIDLVFETRLLRRTDLDPVAGLDLDRVFDLVESHWEPLRAEGFWSPSPLLTLRGDGRYDPSLQDPWLRWAAGSELRDRRGDRLLAAYRYDKGLAGYLDGGAEVAVTRELSLQYRHRYSVRDHRTLEEAYALHLEHPCWELVLSYSRNLASDADEDERRYFATLQLKGLGKIGTLRGILP